MMKSWYLILFFFTLSQTINGQSDEQILIRLGVKEIVPQFSEQNNEIQNKIINGNYNNIDAFEYEVVKLLLNELKRYENVTIQQVKINQDEKLNSISKGEKIDALLYTFSETEERKQHPYNIHFSNPYYQNDGVGIIVKEKDIDVESIGESFLRIGCISETRPIKHLNIIINRLKQYDLEKANKIFIDSSSTNHDELMSKLNSGKIDAAAGDISRLLYETANGNYFFGGFLPLNQSQIKDNYCIGITESKPELVSFFNNILSNNKLKIERLKEKWIGTIGRNFYSKFENKVQNQYNEYILYILIVNVALIIIGIIIANRYFRKKRRELNEKDKTIEDLKDEYLAKQKLKDYQKYRTDIEKLTSALRLKTKNKLTSDLVAQAGIEMFETAEKSITYVGSGGFLSDSEYGNKWLSALHSCLTKSRGDKENFSFTRVVDLPEMDNNEFKFCDNPFFNPPNNDYVKKYFKWLLIQYSNLKCYSKLKLINSRGAALWSYGIVMIIKDQSEVLIFTTTKNSRFGMYIPSPELGESIHTLIKAIIDIGASMNHLEIEKTFLKNDEDGYKLPALASLIDEINELQLGCVLPKETLDKIDVLCEEIKNFSLNQ